MSPAVPSTQKTWQRHGLRPLLTIPTLEGGGKALWQPVGAPPLESGPTTSQVPGPQGKQLTPR